MYNKHRDILHSFNGCFSKESDFYTLSLLFENIKLKCVQSQVSELIDLHNYTIKRNSIRIRKILKSGKPKAFEFVHCLN